MAPKVASATEIDRSSRLHLGITGTVQGVGFRPFIYRLANDLDLNGWVRNSLGGVQIELEGDKNRLRQFLDRVVAEQPSLARIDDMKVDDLTPVGYSGFSVRESDRNGETDAVILPDIATCRDCREEIFDPANRRYRYPFTNCTNCGPRYSIVESLPYDRANTTMRRFTMCDECRREYEDPQNRRFQAQPNGCPKCGPHLELWDKAGKALAGHEKALSQACDLIRAGGILALKGLGGFQLIVDATNDDAVRRLRDRKNRPEKPFALMYPDLPLVENDCELTTTEKIALTSCASPIVLLKRKPYAETTQGNVSHLVAPDNPYLGIMLPYTPLRYLLMADLDGPIVATSGNMSDEPIYTDERDALARLHRVADLFLVHDCPIAQHVDDSIVRVIADRPVVLCSVMGCSEYAQLCSRFHLPIIVTGFEPLDILQGIHMAVAQLEQGHAELENQYARAVKPDGNNVARDMIDRVFRVVDRAWRGFGVIPQGGLSLRDEFVEFDAEIRFELTDRPAEDSSVCISSLILQGIKKPCDCPAFAGSCTPERPQGAPMISSEGACAAYYRYSRQSENPEHMKASRSQ